MGHFLEKATVNEAEYSGLVKGMQLALDLGVQELVVVVDSRLAIQQLQGVIASLCLVHVKRDFNAAADYISKRVIQDQSSLEVADPGERKLLQGLNRIHEKLMKDPSPREQSLMECAFLAIARNIPKCYSRGLGGDVFAVTRSKSKQVKATEKSVTGTGIDDSGTNDSGTDDPGTNDLGTDGPEDEPTAAPRSPNCQDFEEDPENVRRERWRRICSHQAHDLGLAPLVKFLRGETEHLSLKQTTYLVKIADRFVLDPLDALFYEIRSTPERPRDAADRLRLIVLQDLQEDILHHCHANFQGAHQGIIRTSYERLRKEFYWIGMFKDTERYVKECVDCVTAKVLPRNPGPSPGNLLATRRFQVVSMDFVIPLPQSARGNTALLLFEGAFSGFIMCKAMASTEAQDVSEAYEECVFRRFGASEMIRHDRDPRFMGRVFKHFREKLGSRQRATLRYRPQANGQQERSVQTVIRSVKAHTVDQRDWDELAEKLMWALNTSFVFTRLDTPFYLVYGWDAQGTVEAMMGDVPRDVQLRDAQEWCTKVQRQVEYARAWARDLKEKAKKRRAEDHNRKWKQLTDRLKEGFEVGDPVWLYLARVRPGLTKKLAHLWHGPFRIREKGSDFRYRLQVEGTEYRFHPWVHVSRLKPRAKYPERHSGTIDIPEDDDFDAALIREDSWEPDEGSGEYEVEAILD
ncbi:LOW QUALITY PROTEIN: reverse transcriptase, partial [Phytophthora megakarya]